jgi:hypothetical protein
MDDLAELQNTAPLLCNLLRAFHKTFLNSPNWSLSIQIHIKQVGIQNYIRKCYECLFVHCLESLSSSDISSRKLVTEVFVPHISSRVTRSRLLQGLSKS